MKRIIISTFILVCSFGVFAQEDAYKPELNIDLGITDFGEILNYRSIRGLYTFNLEYKPLSFLGVGGQVSYGGYKMFNYTGGETKIAFSMFEYAFFSKIYLTPLLTKIENPKFTLYLKGKIGGLSIYPRDDSRERSNNFEYGAYVGVRYAPIKRIAIYGEIGYAKYSFSQVGLSINLSK